MNPLDAVLKRSTISKASRVLVGGATAAVLFFSPVMGTLAAPGNAHAPSAALQQDDDEQETRIVPVGSDNADEDVDDEDAAEDEDQADEDEQDADEDADEDADDADQDEDENDDRDDEDDNEDEEDTGGETLHLTGIISSKVDLSPNQWMGAIDERLVRPFMVAPQPVRLSSNAIDLDAVVSRGEIVNGEMQTPKDEFDVVWYKETAGAGEEGNMVFAGHLNWYGVPEAVFHDIDQFEKGDKIVVQGENGVEYVYKVKWVKLVATADADMEEIVGPTKKASLTLITCGGEWDPTVSLYKDRTVVRAELVDTNK